MLSSSLVTIFSFGYGLTIIKYQPIAKPRTERVDKKFEERKSEFATKEDVSNLRAELLRTIYLTSLGQLITIIASVVSLILILKK